MMNQKYKSSYQMIILASLINIGMFIMMIKNDKSIMLSWTMMKFKCSNLEMKLMMDYKSLIFSSCVLIITCAVVIYSNNYMAHNHSSMNFLKMVMLFILSMMMVIFSANMISMITGWELLGMTSFILIMFYNNNYSVTSSFLTMMMNRAGDVFLMMGMFYFMNFNSWSFSTMIMNHKTALIMVMMALFSKSAQIPFSSWLTEAMAAPTPVSALVHSSTLVTAGIFIMIRFEESLKTSSAYTMIMLVSMLTINMAGINSVSEWDIKKTVALSTLMQLSMMFISISLGLCKLALLHLILHATFKALLFISSSTLISLNNSQDMRKMHMNKQLTYTNSGFILSNISMCGMPFMSGFYSKDLIMEMVNVNNMNMVMVVSFFMSMMLSLSYSMKMMVMMKSTMIKMTNIKRTESTEQKKSTIMLSVPSVLGGNKINWMINTENLMPIISKWQKVFPIMAWTLALMTMSMNYKKNNCKKKSTNKMKVMTNNMLYMKSFNLQMKNNTLMLYTKMMKVSEMGMKKKMISSINKTMKNMSENHAMMNMMNIKSLMFISMIVMITMKI